jgi:lipopolysaccharide transport system ATP-binding protein
VTAPTSGRITGTGRIASLLEVGTGFHPDLSGRENIYLNGAILGMSRREIDRKFEEIVDFAEVEKFIDTPVKRYSSGMYVRLAFAVAAHLEPEILVVDEVLAVGDAEFQKKCLGKMRDVAREGRTVLFVSHNMLSIQNLCSHALLLKSGNIEYSGLAKDTIKSYLQTQEARSNVLPLGIRTDRKGNQSLKFYRVEICDEENRLINKIISGETITFRFYYTCNRPPKRTEVCVSLVVRDQDYTLTNLNSVDSGQSNLEIFEDGYFECRWPNFNLTARTYDCSLFCSINGEIVDWLDTAFRLEVADGDFFSSGKKIGIQSKFLVGHTWSSCSELNHSRSTS